jgi:ATP-dependent protease ClpP protease subunit
MPDYGPSPLHDQLAALLAEGERTMADRHDRSHAGLSAGERTDPGFRVEPPTARLAADPEGDGGETPDPTVEEASGATKFYIYSEIGGWFGVWPEDVISALAGIKGDVELHLHSPGGDAFDGVAIYNAFRAHEGKVHGIVDGLAASAASVIAMAADDLEMKRGSQLMIHDAWGVAVGPAEDMGQMQKFLNKVSDATASIYAAKAGGTAAEWRTAMKAESWYTDEEAVESGLADTLETSVVAAKSKWNLKAFQHAGRSEAPDPLFPGGRFDLGKWGTVMARSAPGKPPATGTGGRPLVDRDALAQMAEQERQQRSPGGVIPAGLAADLIHQAAQRAAVRAAIQTPAAAVADGPSLTEGADGMPDRDKIREALGLGPDATDAQMQAAWAAAYPAPAPATPPAAEPASAPAITPELAAQASKAGVVLIDSSQLARMQEMAERGQQAWDAQRASERDQVIQQACKVGKIELSRVEHWQKKWDADPEGTRVLLQTLAPNMVPMEAAGYAGKVAENEADSRYLDLYPEDKRTGARRG